MKNCFAFIDLSIVSGVNVSQISRRILEALPKLTWIKGFVGIELFEQSVLTFPNLTRLQLRVVQLEAHYLEDLAGKCPNLEVLSLRFMLQNRRELNRCRTAQFLHVSALLLQNMPSGMDLSLLFSYFPTLHEVVLDSVHEDLFCLNEPLAKALPKTVKILTWSNTSPEAAKFLLNFVHLTVLRVGTVLKTRFFSEILPFPHPNTEHLFVEGHCNEYLIDGRSCHLEDRDRSWYRNQRPELFRRKFLSR